MSSNHTPTPSQVRVLRWVLVLLVGCKLVLAGRSGLFAFEDEGRYTAAARALGHFGGLRWREGLGEVFSTTGRPGDTMVRMLPNALQFATAKLSGLHLYEPGNVYPLFLFNLGVFGLTVWVLLRYARLLFGDEVRAYLVVILYGALVSPQIYLRHALPYDAGLLVLLVVLERISVRIQAGEWSVPGFVGHGALAYFGLAVYPGYYPFVLILGGVICCWRLDPARVMERVRCLGAFGGGAALMIAGLEGLSRLGGRSYLRELTGMSGQINQGSFDEALVFPFKYVMAAEGWAALLILLGWAVAVWVSVRAIGASWRRGVDGPGVVVLLMTLACLGYGAYGTFFRGMVYYGRLVHPYYPLMCVAFVQALDAVWLRGEVGGRSGRVLWVVAACCGVAGFNLIRLNQFHYPADVAWPLVKTRSRAEVLDHCEFERGFSHVPPAHLFRGAEPVGRGDVWILVNACVYYPIGSLDRRVEFEPRPGDQLVEDRRHFMTFEPYLWEGYKPEERDLIRSVGMRVRVYRRRL